MAKKDRPKLLVFVGIYLIHGLYLIPEFLDTKKDEIVYRILTQIPFLFLLLALYLMERNSYAFDFFINLAHIVKAVSGIMLKNKMLKNGSNIKMNPIYLLPTGIGLYLMTFFVMQNYGVSSLAMLVQSIIVVVL